MVVSNQLFPKSHNNIETSTCIAFTIPEYEGEPFAVINQNIPFFEKDDYTTESFENYSELDELGRCGVAYANISKELMPTEERGQIGAVRPSGWHTVK